MAGVALAVVLGVAALLAALVIGVALAALLQRRSAPYLLVTLAFVTLLARTGVGVALMTGSVDSTTHHTVEHGLDAVMAGLVIAAVYTARHDRGGTATRIPDGNENPDGDESPDERPVPDGDGVDDDT